MDFHFRLGVPVESPELIPCAPQCIHTIFCIRLNYIGLVGERYVLSPKTMELVYQI
jgi:hypothetical protein